MKIKNFNSYSRAYSKNPNDFEYRIALASPVVKDLVVFKVVNTANEAFSLSSDIPVILWNNFNFSNDGVNESFCSQVYNQNTVPTLSKIMDDFEESDFVPRKVTDRSLVKKMKFPITGVNSLGKTDFSTYGRFKKSEDTFDFFKEKPVPISRMEALVSGDRPIHLHKKINGIQFDVDLRSSRHADKIKEICEGLGKKYSPEFYSITLIETANGLQLESIGSDSILTPSQGFKLYEAAFESHYQTTLPNWMKTRLFESYVKPYYKKRYYDSLLIKPTGTIDYKKYID